MIKFPRELKPCLGLDDENKGKLCLVDKNLNEQQAKHRFFIFLSSKENSTCSYFELTDCFVTFGIQFVHGFLCTVS